MTRLAFDYNKKTMFQDYSSALEFLFLEFRFLIHYLLLNIILHYKTINEYYLYRYMFLFLLLLFFILLHFSYYLLFAFIQLLTFFVSQNKKSTLKNLGQNVLKPFSNSMFLNVLFFQSYF